MNSIENIDLLRYTKPNITIKDRDESHIEDKYGTNDGSTCWLMG